MVEIKLLRLSDKAKPPRRATSGAAGWDFASLHDVVLDYHARRQVRTGWAVEIPAGYEIQIRPRSGLAHSWGITVFNSPGTIDADFRGELQILLVNHGWGEYRVKAGDWIAQAVIAPIIPARFVEVPELSTTERGASGWGSTGE